MAGLNLAVNKYAFHWSFPEILADSLGLFEKRGAKVRWSDVTPPGVVNKTSMYTDLLKSGATDVYHAAEWACINRVLKSDYAWIAATSPPGEGTLNSSFTLYSRRDSDVTGPSALVGGRVAIEEGTGAQYTTVLDLENFVDVADVTLVQVGEPHRRLKALLEGEVDAASLVGPWSDVGDVIGLRPILRTKRTNPTTIVVRKEMDLGALKAFFGGTNEAIALIDRDPARYASAYFERVKVMLDQLDLEVSADRLRDGVRVPRWEKWAPYTTREFEAAYAWMVERGLAHISGTRTGTVANYPSSVFA